MHSASGNSSSNNHPIFGFPPPQQPKKQTFSFGSILVETSSSSNNSPNVKDIVPVLPDDTLDSCKCDYCNCYVSVGPVRMVDNKISCGRCCRDKDGVRVLMIEALAKQFHFPCRYKAIGCNGLLKWALIDSHEKVCDYREIKCTIADCDWNGAKSTLKAHFEQKHANEVINSQKGVLINLDEKKTCNFLYVTKDKAFLLFLSNNGQTIEHHVKFFCTSLMACMYKYNICIYDSDKKLVFLNQNLQSFDDNLCTINAGIHIDMLRSVFINSDNINISFQIKHTNSETKEVSMQSIECPVCLEPMVHNIYIGQCGHSFCEKCKKLLQNCPCCRSDIFTSIKANKSSQEIRNYSLESLIKKLNLEL